MKNIGTELENSAGVFIVITFGAKFLSHRLHRLHGRTPFILAKGHTDANA